MVRVPLIFNSQQVGRESNLPFFSNSPINWFDHQDMLNSFQALIAFYNQSEALKKGITSNYPNNDISVFARISNTEQILVKVNILKTQATVNVTVALLNTSWTGVFSVLTIELGNSMTFESIRYMILKKNRKVK